MKTSTPFPAPPQASGESCAEEHVGEDSTPLWYLKAALLLHLTGGATYGAYVLTRVAIGEAFGAVPRAFSQAHGHVQVYGWVGLFIMGVASIILPRLKAAAPFSRPAMAVAFLLMTGGIVLRAVAQPYLAGSWLWLLPLSGAMEVAASAIFLREVFRLLRGARKEACDVYFRSGTAWFLAGMLMNLGLCIDMALPGAALPQFASEWVGPLRHVQFFGMGMMWIFGVGVKTLPMFLGVAPIKGPVAVRLAWVLNVALAVMTFTEVYGPRHVFYAMGAVHAVALYWFLFAAHVFSRPLPNRRPVGVWTGYMRFVRMAYVWLAIGVGIVALLPVWMPLGGDLHILIGASTHAVTVGFLSFMIVGYSLKIVPMYMGVPLALPRAADAAFWLMTAGNVLRVGLQFAVGMGAGGAIFVPMGVSGWLEVTGLTLFSVALWRTMRSPQAAVRPAEALGPDASVAAIIRRRPEAREVLIRLGFTKLANPILLQTMGAVVTLRQACQVQGVELSDALRELSALESAGAAR